MANSDTYRIYVRDVVFEMIEEAARARESRDRLPRGERKNFQAGVTFGLYTVLSSMAQKAKAFGIPLAQTGLDKVDADRELAR